MGKLIIKLKYIKMGTCCGGSKSNAKGETNLQAKGTTPQT